MFRKSMIALAGAVSAFAFTAANAATFSYGFAFTVAPWLGDDGPTEINVVGEGKIFADDNHDGSFTVTGATGAVTSGFPFGDDEITDADTFSMWWDDESPTVATIYSDGGDPAFYSFERLRLMGNYYYDFAPIAARGNSFYTGVSFAEMSAVTTFSLSLDAEQSLPAPEAATWAMMLVGFGAVGGAMRSPRTKISFA